MTEDVDDNTSTQQSDLADPKEASLFNSGWRPALGWVLVVSVALYFIPRFVIADVLWLRLCWNSGAIVAYPIDDSGLWQLATMMLGGQAIRSVDKFIGTAKH